MNNPNTVRIPREKLTGRRAVLARGLAGAVAAIVSGKVTANEIPPIDEAYVTGIAQADIGNNLRSLPDNVVDTIDEGNPAVGKARQLIERALNKILKRPK